MRSVAVACVVLASGGAAAASPKASKVDGGLPAGVKATGTLDQAWTFTDKGGIGYVLFSAKRSKGKGPDGPTQSVYLFVDSWVLPPGGKAKRVRTVRDLVEDCEDDVTAQFHDAAFGVTDVDGDGVAEVTFAYETGCRSDVSPNTYKLLLLRGADKFILRGQTLIRDPGGGAGNAGGAFTPDPDAAHWPKGAFAHAKEVWNQTDADSAIPPVSMDGGGGGAERHGPYDPPDPCGG